MFPCLTQYSRLVGAMQRPAYLTINSQQPPIMHSSVLLRKLNVAHRIVRPRSRPGRAVSYSLWKMLALCCPRIEIATGFTYHCLCCQFVPASHYPGPRSRSRVLFEAKTVSDDTSEHARTSIGSPSSLLQRQQYRDRARRSLVSLIVPD
jgi:hypothetical protein